MLLRLYRHRRKLLLSLAAMPVMQVTGCDTNSLVNALASSAIAVGSQINVAVFQLFVASVQSTLLRNFPSADILQILLGGNRTPFFPF